MSFLQVRAAHSHTLRENAGLPGPAQFKGQCTRSIRGLYEARLKLVAGWERRWRADSACRRLWRGDRLSCGFVAVRPPLRTHAHVWHGPCPGTAGATGTASGSDGTRTLCTSRSFAAGGVDGEDRASSL